MNKTVEVVRERERESYNLEKNGIANKAINIIKKVKKSLMRLIKYEIENIRIGYLASKKKKASKEKQSIKRIKLLQDSLSFL